MKTIDIDFAIQAEPGLLAAVRRANETLDCEMGRWAGDVSAAWQVVRDEPGRQLVRVAISDETGTADAVLTARDLGDPREARSRLLQLWIDFLRIRSHKYRDEVLAAAQDSETT